MQRRELLKWAAGALTLPLAQGVRAQMCPPPETGPWGAIPAALDWPDFDPTTGWATPIYEGVKSYKVLEIFLLGGASPWDTFAADKPAYELFRRAHARPGCGTDRLSFAGAPRLAPSLAPLDMLLPYSGRASTTRGGRLFDHMRIVPLRHQEIAHQGAVPISMHGLPISQRRMAATGASIARRLDDPTAMRSVVISPISPSFGMEFSDATGAHPGWTRPLFVNLAGGGELSERLARSHYRDAPLDASRHDALLEVYRAQYRRNATPAGSDTPLRSTGLAAYETAARALPFVPPLAPHFRDVGITELATSREAPFCRELSALSARAATRRSNASQVTIDLGVRLLSDPGGGVRHVVVFDTGMVHDDNFFTYDGHFHLADYHDNALHASMSRLAYHIDNQNIDLRDTLVVINTEFGRTAGPQSGGDDGGRDHNPGAAFCVMIGGPTLGPFVWGDFTHEMDRGTPTGSGDSLGFTNGPGSMMSREFALPPAAVRAAVLLAAGVHPLTRPELFEISELGLHAVRSRGDGASPMCAPNIFANLKEAVFRGGI